MINFKIDRKKVMEDYKMDFIKRLNDRDITEILNLTKAKGNTYICPICRSGSGENRTGLQVTKDKRRITCFAGGCFGDRGEDVLGALKSITGESENAILSKYFVEYDIKKALTTESQEVQLPHKIRKKEKVQEVPDHRAYYEECFKRLEEPAPFEYLTKRGISLSTAKKCHIGFDAKADPAQSRHHVPRLIIPTSPSHYIGRRIDGIQEYAKINSKGGKAGIFNTKVLYDADVVFVVEGVFDAMSIMEAGASAISLNGINQTGKLLELLKEKSTKAFLIICLDNEKDPKKQAKVDKSLQSLEEGLKKLKIDYITANITGKYKDANEALINDKGAFIDAVKSAIRQTTSKPDNISDYLVNFFIEDIIKFREYRHIKTGYNNLDEKIGSLYPGLYSIGAISSLGKTTFMHQMADQMAASGQDVLYFSLEQSIFELVSKSISRIIAQKGCIDKAVTALEVREGKWNVPQTSFEKQKKQVILDAIADYQERSGNRLSIIQGDFNCNVDFIRSKVKHYIKKNRTKPVVIVDYLQAMIMGNDGGNARGEIDSIVIDFKRLSRDEDLVIMIISSFNRANYLSPVDYESFKESGGIDYTSDVIWGLQLQALNEANEVDAGSKGGKYEKTIAKKRDIIRVAKQEIPRKIEFVCLKNRYGLSGYKLGFKYYSNFDLFTMDTSYNKD